MIMLSDRSGDDRHITSCSAISWSLEFRFSRSVCSVQTGCALDVVNSNVGPLQVCSRSGFDCPRTPARCRPTGTRSGGATEIGIEGDIRQLDLNTDTSTDNNTRTPTASTAHNHRFLNEAALPGI
ncbi:hypothetical protein [Nonomuraea sp. LPB2021202275-12-8]|uniref:hypothetical protein n=1 Tax=Nonomuraea sp. LPB2021202275-12-8 TaxID=3120159 RepID=UPI00300C75CB